MIESHRANLVKEIEQQLGHPLSPPIQQAFLQVPRELFVPSYYQQAVPHSFTWNLISRPSQEELYHDVPLVTRIDAQGRPVSSSSQPSIMAAQLEALSLHERCHVLEIGAGTGYNAALMCVAMQKQGFVVSVDIEREFVVASASRLQAMGLTSFLTVTTDGYAGYLPQAPYNRIIATCAMRFIPHAWITQLAPGGILICNLQLPLASVFLHLEKQTDENNTITGRFLPINASYMPLMSPSHPLQSDTIDWSLTKAEPQIISLSAEVESLLQNRAFLVLLQCFCPGLIKKCHGTSDRLDWHLVAQGDRSTETIITVQADTLLVYGARNNGILENLLSCISAYRDRFGSPDEAAYALIFDQPMQNATLMLSEHAYSFNLTHESGQS